MPSPSIDKLSSGLYSVDGLFIDLSPTLPDETQFIAPSSYQPTPHDRELTAFRSPPAFMLAYLQLQASVAREQLASSYRNFLVGAAALVLFETRAQVLVGGNIKKHPNDPKLCAEMVIRDKIEQPDRKLGLARVAAIAVHGPPDFSSVYDIDTLTLHPCSDCQAMMSETPEFDDQTLVLTTVGELDNPDTYRTELQTIATIRQIHAGNV